MPAENFLEKNPDVLNITTWGRESSAPFLWFTKTEANPRRIGDRLVLVVR
jgi:hypothetical protein